MIRSFRDKETEARVPPRAEVEVRPPPAAGGLAEAAARGRGGGAGEVVLPGNRLEKLVGDREGQYSIRINDRWRICFRWEDGGAHDVEIADYH